MSDMEVAEWFIRLLKHTPLSFIVATGSKPVPGPIDERVKASIADSDCVIAIFTKRHHDTAADKWLPSQFVLCEAASGIGFYYNTNRLICGFYELGINPQDLALITIGGLQLLPFDRSKLNDDRSKFIEYLKKLPDRLTAGSFMDGKSLLPPESYTQQSLRKIITVYGDGGITVQNITKILINDAARFVADRHGEIEHDIWNHRGGLPLLASMIKTPIHLRRTQAFLKGICRRLNTKRIDAPLKIRLDKQDNNTASFFVSFYDQANTQLHLKDHDTIQYEYAWSLPHAFASSEEELSSVDGNAKIEDVYNHAEVKANHGVVRDMVLELRFERAREPLFDKSPFYQKTESFKPTPHWSKASEAPADEDELDHEMWYATFKLAEKNFHGRVRVLWRPASSKMTA